MNTKAFMLLLVGVLVLGGSIGGAFAGGVAVGKGQEAEAAPSDVPTQLPAGSGQQFTDQFSQEQLDQFRQQFQGEFGQGAGVRGGFSGRGGLSGTIESIEGNILTINTLQGPLQTTIGEDTVIQQFAQGTLADLQTGARVTVTGERGEDGTVEASSILLIPEGTEGPFGGGGRRQRDQQAP